MASSKQKTTMNKLNRERKVRERRIDKEARKLARANAPAETEFRPHDEFQNPVISEPAGGPAEEPAPSAPIEP
jgi:hypothetical protein